MKSDKIKILHIIASPVFGGAERLLLTLSKNIDQKKFDLFLGIFIDQRKENNLMWSYAKKLNLKVDPINCKNPYDLLQILHIYRIVKKHHPDIIHTHGYKTNILGFLVSKLFGIPIVVTVHGLYPIKTKTNLRQRLSLMLLKHFDRIIAVSSQMNTVLKSKKVSSKKIINIRNVPPINVEEHSSNIGTLREEIGIPSNLKVLGFVGRLEYIKGCDLLIQAVSKIHSTNLDFCLVVVGDGPERKSLDLLVRKLGLKKYVYFCGFRNDIKNVFQSLDLYVLPSFNEGIPLAMLEAMSHGVPVVATRVGGIPEVIKDKVNGILVPPRNPEALAEGIMEALSSPEETAKRVIEAKKTIQNEYSIEQWIKKIQNTYLEMVK